MFNVVGLYALTILGLMMNIIWDAYEIIEGNFVDFAYRINHEIRNDNL